MQAGIALSCMVCRGAEEHQCCASGQQAGMLKAHVFGSASMACFYTVFCTSWCITGVIAVLKVQLELAACLWTGHSVRGLGHQCAKFIGTHLRWLRILANPATHSRPPAVVPTRCFTCLNRTQHAAGNVGLRAS